MAKPPKGSSVMPTPSTPDPRLSLPLIVAAPPGNFADPNPGNFISPMWLNSPHYIDPNVTFEEIRG
eukprot:12869510-Heterocapsa_arctica.AAC.1